MGTADQKKEETLAKGEEYWKSYSVLAAKDQAKRLVVNGLGVIVVVVDLLFYVHGKHLRSCQDGQLT